jgi:hypothetical protein
VDVAADPEPLAEDDAGPLVLQGFLDVVGSLDPERRGVVQDRDLVVAALLGQVLGELLRLEPVRRRHPEGGARGRDVVVGQQCVHDRHLVEAAERRRQRRVVRAHHDPGHPLGGEVPGDLRRAVRVAAVLRLHDLDRASRRLGVLGGEPGRPQGCLRELPADLRHRVEEPDLHGRGSFPGRAPRDSGLAVARPGLLPRRLVACRRQEDEQDRDRRTPHVWLTRKVSDHDFTFTATAGSCTAKVNRPMLVGK